MDYFGFWYLAMMLLGLIVPVLVIYLIIRGIYVATHHEQMKGKTLTVLQFKKAAVGSAIAFLVPLFLYQLMYAFFATSSTADYNGATINESAVATGMVIGGVVALLGGVMLWRNKTAGMGLAFGGLLCLVSQFISNFDNLNGLVRVGIIGVALVILIAAAVYKTVEREHKEPATDLSKEG